MLQRHEIYKHHLNIFAILPFIKSSFTLYETRKQNKRITPSNDTNLLGCPSISFLILGLYVEELKEN